MIGEAIALFYLEEVTGHGKGYKLNSWPAKGAGSSDYGELGVFVLS